MHAASNSGVVSPRVESARASASSATKASESLLLPASTPPRVKLDATPPLPLMEDQEEVRSEGQQDGDAASPLPSPIMSVRSTSKPMEAIAKASSVEKNLHAHRGKSLGCVDRGEESPADDAEVRRRGRATKHGQGKVEEAGAVRVSIRIRPAMTEEERDECWETWSGAKGDTLTLTHDQEDPSKERDQSFVFDRIFGNTATNQEIYQEVMSPGVTKCLDGYNFTVFCYGQTGTGKTLTMLGSAEDLGLVYRTTHELVQQAVAHETRRYLIRAECFEIYNEDVRDLLNPSNTKLKVVDHTVKGPYCAGITERLISHKDDMVEVLRCMTANRVTSSTNMNSNSSRSHAMVRLTVESREVTEGEAGGLVSLKEAVAEVQKSRGMSVQYSRLNFVDLAGSERSSKSGASGSTLKEGAMINKSLVTLGQCIRELSMAASASSQCTRHIPFRDSKLTRLLQQSLGGNSYTAAICNISAARVHAEETKSTLRFASFTSLIKNSVKKNESKANVQLLKQYRQEIEKLKQQLGGDLEDQMMRMQEQQHEMAAKLEEVHKEAVREKSRSAILNTILNMQSKRSPGGSGAKTASNGDVARQASGRSVGSPASSLRLGSGSLKPGGDADGLPISSSPQGVTEKLRVVRVANLWQRTMLRTLNHTLLAKTSILEEQVNMSQSVSQALAGSLERGGGLDEAGRADVQKLLNEVSKYSTFCSTEDELTEALRVENDSLRSKLKSLRVANLWDRAVRVSLVQKMQMSNELLESELARCTALTSTMSVHSKGKEAQEAARLTQLKEEMQTLKESVHQAVHAAPAHEEEDLTKSSKFVKLVNEIATLESSQRNNLHGASLLNWQRWRAAESKLQARTEELEKQGRELEEANRWIEQLEAEVRLRGDGLLPVLRARDVAGEGESAPSMQPGPEWKEDLEHAHREILELKLQFGRAGAEVQLSPRQPGHTLAANFADRQPSMAGRLRKHSRTASQDLRDVTMQIEELKQELSGASTSTCRASLEADHNSSRGSSHDLQDGQHGKGGTDAGFAALVASSTAKDATGVGRRESLDRSRGSFDLPTIEERIGKAKEHQVQVQRGGSTESLPKETALSSNMDMDLDMEAVDDLSIQKPVEAFSSRPNSIFNLNYMDRTPQSSFTGGGSRNTSLNRQSGPERCSWCSFNKLVACWRVKSKETRGEQRDRTKPARAFSEATLDTAN
mmetsp:Transcript_47726/g.91210  ORF Transcript_47726/g.91210 Transcript_47726/m.91210 type:complete len:1201 (+) Transcript_47726:285-3887(+)